MARKIYTPKKYFSGLSKTMKLKRKKEIAKFGKKDSKDPSAYVGFKTDSGVKTRKSKYVKRFKQMYPDVSSLEGRSKVTGVPLNLIKQSYNRGMAAWRTGHRPGASQQQWGYGRVDSFLTCGKTYYTTDSDLVRNAKKTSKKARSWWSKTCKA
jgi:hypothetical protein